MTSVNRPAQPEHILIFGGSKTGTTGVYTAVKQGLAKAGLPARTVFEPTSPRPLDSLFRTACGMTVMTKVTMDQLDAAVPDIEVFDRRVMTVRDPRDTLISALLFRPITSRNARGDRDQAIEAFITALEEKEADPSSHSVRDLFVRAEQLGLGRPPYRGMGALLDRQRDLHDRGLVHTVRYERFVADDLDDLGGYLGFPVANAAVDASSWVSHITRSKSSGEFSRWFLDSDLEYFNTLFAQFLRAFGYPADVPLETDVGIDAATSSEYVRRKVTDRRRRLTGPAEGPWDPTDVTREGLDALVERGNDGSATACVRAAEVLLAGHLGAPDPAAALDLARYAAQLGSARGRRLTIDVLQQLGPDTPARRRELRVWRRPPAPDDEAERALRQLRASTRYRVGSALADAARHPVKKGPDAVRLIGTSAWSRARKRVAARRRST